MALKPIVLRMFFWELLKWFNFNFTKDGQIDEQQWGVKSTGNHDTAHSSNVVRDNGLHLNFAKKQSANFAYSGAHVQSKFQNLGQFQINI